MLRWQSGRQRRIGRIVPFGPFPYHGDTSCTPPRRWHLLVPEGTPLHLRG